MLFIQTFIISRSVQLLLLIWLTISFVAADERLSSSKCASLTDKQQCTKDAYCCFNQGSQQCYSPSTDEDFDCPAITNEASCGVWSAECRWNETDSKCLRQPINTQSQCAAAWSRRSAEKDNTYCWPERKRASTCVFPFTYNNRTFTSCASVEDVPPPIPALSQSAYLASIESNGHRGWCAITAGSILNVNHWDYCACTAKKRPKNVMFFILDDLRPEFPVYGRQHVVVPNIEELSRRAGSVVMEKAFALFPLCAPSRAAFLSGLSPDYTGVVDSFARGLDTNQNFRKTIRTLPQVFRDNGFFSAGGGKVYHLHHDDAESWDQYYFKNVDQNIGACQVDKKKVKLDPNFYVDTKFSCETRQPETGLLDFRVATSAKRMLDTIVRDRREPFFMAVGIFKPHTPQQAHVKYWNMYPPQGVEETTRLEGPEPASSYRVDLTFDLDSELKSPLWSKDTFQQRIYRNTMRTGYLAALSQSDAVVGEMLGKLEDLKLTDSTMVVLIGDNGIALGENGMFGKDTTFDIAARVPVVFHVPWLAKGSDRRVNRMPDLFQLTDLLGTMASLMNVRLNPKFPYHGVDHGRRIALHASDQAMGNSQPVRTMAFTQVNRCPQKACTFAPLNKMSHVGYSIRTDQWRYTVFLRVILGKSVWTQGIVSEELYAHQHDERDLLNYSDGATFEVETENIAAENPEVCKQMFRLISLRFNTTYPLDKKLIA